MNQEEGSHQNPTVPDLLLNFPDSNYEKKMSAVPGTQGIEFYHNGPSKGNHIREVLRSRGTIQMQFCLH